MNCQPPARLSVGSVILLTILCSVFLGQAALFHGPVNDDAYITFRYSRFLAEGHGPYFNPGERVEGYTNFLLMVWSAFVIHLAGPGAAPAAAQAVGVLSGLGSLLVTFALCRRLARYDEAGSILAAICGLLAAGLVAVCPAHALYSMSGLETNLFGFLLCLGVYLGVCGREAGRWRGSGAAFAAAALSRPEGAAIFAVYWCMEMLIVSGRLVDPSRRTKARRCLLLDGAIVTVAVAGHLLLRWSFYDGEWLPNTYYAKAGGAAQILPRDYILAGVLPPLLGWIGLIVGGGGWGLSGNQRRASAPVVAAGIAGALLPLAEGADWMLGSRLIVPYLPLLAIPVAIGWCKVMGRLRLSNRADRVEGALPSSRWAWALLLLLPLAFLYQSPGRIWLQTRVAARATGFRLGHVALSDWLTAHTESGDCIALMDIGLVGYNCIDRRILDISGLTDRHIAKSPGAFANKQYDPAYVLNQHPKYIVIVLGAPGDPSRPPQGDVPLTPWTTTERAIATHPDFARWYVHRPDTRPTATRDWRPALAEKIGAERVFQHHAPDYHYLLAVFRRLDAE